MQQSPQNGNYRSDGQETLRPLWKPKFNSGVHIIASFGLYLQPDEPSTPSGLCFNPYPTAFPYGNGMVLHFYQQQESSTTKTVHRVINKGLKAYV